MVTIHARGLLLKLPRKGSRSAISMPFLCQYRLQAGCVPGARSAEGEVSALFCQGLHSQDTFDHRGDIWQCLEMGFSLHRSGPITSREARTAPIAQLSHLSIYSMEERPCCLHGDEEWTGWAVAKVSATQTITRSAPAWLLRAGRIQHFQGGVALDFRKK